MSNTTNEQIIWNHLKKAGYNNYAIAGIMGNLKAESGLNPKNMQNCYEAKLNMNDENYTCAVDNGSYANFVKDAVGYGLAQWTYWSRKQNLHNFAKSKNKSIGDLEMQLEFLCSELKGYTDVHKVLLNAKSVKEASDAVLTGYEKPADQSNKVKETRAVFGQAYYDKYAKTLVEEVTTTVSRKSAEEIAKEVIAGKWGNGQERKDKLAAVGYNAAEIQIIVNRLLGKTIAPAQAPAETNRTYTVKADDNLCKIAREQLKDENRYTEIKTLNGLKSNTIYKGQVLKLPN